MNVRWSLSADEEQFRAEAHEWLSAELQRDYLRGRALRSSTEYFGIEPEFSRRLGEAGYLAVTTPVEYGGPGRSHVEQALLSAELAWAQAPILGHFVAEREVLPSLLRFGSSEQRSRYIPDLLAGRMLCSQGFTEPGAGSDLAGITTTAQVESDGSYVISGVKWLNSVAQVASHLWLLVRTGEKPGHGGLSMFLLPVDLPGIRVEPLVEMTGVHRLNRIVLDDVTVPASAMVGEPGQGWAVAMDTVARERAGAHGPAGLRRLLDDVATEVTGPGAAAAAERLAELRVRIESAELLSHRYASQTDAGANQPDLGGITLKVHCDALEQELADLGSTLLGRRGTLDIDGQAPVGGRFGRRHVAAPGLSLGGGTQEILKTVLAQRGLGLPRQHVGDRDAAQQVRTEPELAAPEFPPGSGLSDRLHQPPESALTPAELGRSAYLVGLFSAGLRPDLRELGRFARSIAAAGAANLLVPHVVLPWMLGGARTDGEVWTTALGQGHDDLDLGHLTAAYADGVVTGRADCVPGALSASRLLVAATRDQRAVLAVVDLAAADVVPQPTIGRGGDAVVELRSAPARPVDDGPVSLDDAFTVATFVQAAEGAGLIDRMLQLSVDQGRRRFAFGRPVGTNQAFQHLCADMAMERELVEAAVDNAAVTGDPDAVRRARILAADAAVRVSRNALQLHGGRGFLDDSEVARLYRQAKVSQLRWGGPSWHLAGRHAPPRGSTLLFATRRNN